MTGCFLTNAIYTQNKNFTFINNSALLSGDAMYADSLYSCPKPYLSMFHFQSNGKFALSSKPAHICTCNETTDPPNNMSSIDVTMYPSEKLPA